MLREFHAFSTIIILTELRRLGYSQKGWTDNVIGVEYAKQFEKETRALARGRYRTLYVDGHRSHVTRKFLLHCRDNKIIASCYPAHTTHIYQGLDVVVFSALKAEFGKCRDRLLRETGEAISKENFLRVYGEAHLKVLTPELVKMAFRKTGVVPFNRNVITGDMLAPSKDTSFRHFSPVEPPKAVRIMTDMMVDVLQPVLRPENNADEGGDLPIANSPRRGLFPMRTALPELSSTEYGFLLSKSPIKASSNPPTLPTIEISPIKVRANAKSKRQEAVKLDLLTAPMETAMEKALQKALIAKNSEALYYKNHAAALQSTMVLQRIYCLRVRRQLNTKEIKDKKKGKKGKILGDGLPRLLTGDAFLEVLDEYEAAEEEAARRKAARDALKAEYEAELEEWEKNEKGRKNRNDALLQKFTRELAEWEGARKKAKEAWVKLKDWDQSHPKPKKKDFVEKAAPKPKLKKIDDLPGNEGEVGGDDAENWTDEDEEEG